MRHFWLSLALLVLALISVTATAADKPQAAAPKSKVNELSRAEIEAGWIKLFDGETLFGWKSNADINWTIQDGILDASEGPAGMLVSTCEFESYELRCDFKLDKGGNSGVFLQSIFEPKDPNHDCYELNICDSHPAFPTGSIVTLQKPDQVLVGEEAWKTFHVTVRGPALEVKLDGKPVLSFHDTRPGARAKGFIGLQKNAGHVQFRNVFLRPLGLKPIFNGKDLAGWRLVPGGKSEFKVENGAIHVTNGRGYLETEKVWDDFILQADIISNGKHLNSGIFFRALPGTEKNPAEGYESQVRNQWEGDDRTKPVDFGTGAIYRRVAARRVVSRDHEWFTKTLIAQGPHMAVWIDGYQVTDWTDERPPSENGRNGLRLKAGHLSIQGHDPTTDLSFKNLRITEPAKSAP